MARKSTHPKITLIILCSEADQKKAEICLASMPWADEKIVYHTFKVVREFAALRNKLLSSAKNDWVFFLDADERLVADEGEVRRVLEVAVSKGNVAVSFLRQDIFLGKMLKWGEVAHVRLPRLMLKEKVKFFRSVHELPECEGSVLKSELVIQHDSQESVAHFFSKVGGYSLLEAESRSKAEKLSFFTQLLFYPVGKFIFNYGVRLGFLDGWRGFIYATLMSFHSFFVRVFQYENQSRS